MPGRGRRTRMPGKFEGLKAVGHHALFRRLAVVQVRKYLQNVLFTLARLLLHGSCAFPFFNGGTVLALPPDVASCCKWHFNLEQVQILAVEDTDWRKHTNDHVTVQRGEAADERLGLGHLELQVVDQKTDAAGVLRAREEDDVPVALQTLARLFAAAVGVLQSDDACRATLSIELYFCVSSGTMAGAASA